MTKFDVVAAKRFAALALNCIHKEYPNKIAHVLNGDADAKPPRELTPAFYGCFDWHSAVHGHWLLVRLIRTFPAAEFASEGRIALARTFTPGNISGEVEYVEREGRETFERPYGLAWLLQLAAELREWDDPQAQDWWITLHPLETAVANRLKQWLPKLSHPIREGEHTQTAFSFGMILDWTRVSGDAELEALLISCSRSFYLNDRNGPLSYEPSGQDFLSPCIAEADLMRRILTTDQFSTWLTAFLPFLPTDGSQEWLPPTIGADPADGKLAHLDGLNLSRAWMLEGIASALRTDDPRLPSLIATAAIHREKGLRAITEEHYQGSHWLGTFAVYLITKRGITSNYFFLT